MNMTDLIKTDVEDIYKNDNGLININNEKLKAYKKQKQHFRRISEMETRITNLEQELQLLKEKIEKT